MLLVHYTTRSQLERAVGEPLKFFDTGKDDIPYSPSGEFRVYNGLGRLSFTAKVTMREGLIEKVEVE